jgi:hypothetical protein
MSSSQSEACILFSEDFPDRQAVKDLEIFNPFTGEWKDYL